MESEKKWYKLFYLLMQSRNRDTDVKKTYGYQERKWGWDELGD